MKIIADLDGTILARWSPNDYTPRPLRPYLRAHAILTNQGGIALRWSGLAWARKYPGLRETLARVRAGMRVSGARLALLAVHHPKQRQTLRGVILETIGQILPPIPIGGGIWLSLKPAHRKPNPHGLWWICRRLRVSPSEAVFYGDEDSDREAARRAGMTFRARTPTSSGERA